MTAHETVTGLRERVLATVGRHVRPGARVALIDYPNHTNVGDSAIWLGEVEALGLLGARVVYECEGHGHDPRAVDRAVGADGIVLLHGGGNFGDEWPEYQRLREGVIAAHRDRPVVVLPQTLRFNREENRARAAAAMAAHPRLTLLCRDGRSAATARALAPAATVELCPDAAFALGRRAGGQAPAGDALWLTRTDAERRGPRLLPPTGRGRVIDWMAGETGDLDARTGERLLRGVVRHGGQRATRRPRVAVAARRAVRALHSGLARRRVQLGLDLVASAPVVVTDRLHAHILCLLAGVPHVVVDTGYGKLRAFVDAWTAGHPLLRLAGDAPAAEAAAHDLVAGSAPVLSTPEAIHA
jgi:exopolysaccharide biosynthesis protein PssK